MRDAAARDITPDIEAMRAQSASLGEASKADDGPAWTTGVEQIDAHLPSGGIARSGLHEIEPLRPTDMPVLTGFAFGLLSRLATHHPIIWCVTAQQIGDCGQPYAFGLERYGISPAQIIFARVNHPVDMQFALEEALKAEGIAAVIGEGPKPNFTGSRRLSLLCKAHKRPCLLMSPKADEGQGSAALTRWQIKPEPGVEDPHDPFGPGLPTWRIALPRVRGAPTLPGMPPDTDTSKHHASSYPWRIVWDDKTHSFRPASVFASGAVSEHRERPGETHQTPMGHTD